MKGNVVLTTENQRSLELVSNALIQIRSLSRSKTANQQTLNAIWEIADAAHNIPAAIANPDKHGGDGFYARSTDLAHVLSRT